MPIKSILFVIAISLIAAVAATAETVDDCRMRVMQACWAIEKNRPDSSRGGASASEFCAATAVLQCRR